MSERVESVRKLVEDARAAQGERKYRLTARASRAICGIVYTAAHVAELPARVRAWLPREPGAPDATWDELLTLVELNRSLCSYEMPDRPIVSSISGNKHKAERIKKRMLKRASRRSARREEKNVVRKQIA